MAEDMPKHVGEELEYRLNKKLKIAHSLVYFAKVLFLSCSLSHVIKSNDAFVLVHFVMLILISTPCWYIPKNVFT
jgi:hypothetical protein